MQAEIIRDKVKKAFAENPGNYQEALEEIGFTWYADEYMFPAHVGMNR